jgi:acetyltransferase
LIQIRQLESPDRTQFLDLCELLIDAVEGGASVGFLGPLTMRTAADYWESVISELSSGLGLFIAEEEDRIVGTVQVALCGKENGQHRAEIRKLCVLQSRRREGIGAELMRAAGAFAVAQGRTLLVLDTQEGSAAEAMYARSGWQRVGAIPDYAASPNGTLHGTVFFSKRIEPDG